MYFKCVVLALVASSVLARSTPIDHDHETKDDRESSRSLDSMNLYVGGLRYAYKVYRECAETDMSTCLKLKLVAAMDRADRAFPEVAITDGVSFVKEPNAPEDNETPKSEKELETTLPRSLNEKDDALNSMIAKKIRNFFNTHRLQVKLPTVTDMQRSFVEEGRKKKKNKDSQMIVPMVLGGTLIPLAIAGLAFFAGKALFVSTLALIIAGIIGLRRIISGSLGGGETAHQVVLQHDAHDSYARSLNDDSAQNLAYNAYVPNNTR